MRTLLKLSFPVEASNNAIKDGSLPKILDSLLERLAPEAAYFWTQDGQRGGVIVFDLKHQSDIPSIAEPLFMGMNATVEFSPVMNADDLKAGLEKARKAS